MPLALYALAVGAFGIGVTEFVMTGLLVPIGADLGVSIAAAGLLVSGYAIGAAVGAPALTALSRHVPRKAALAALMLIFTIGNAAGPGFRPFLGSPVCCRCSRSSPRF